MTPRKFTAKVDTITDRDLNRFIDKTHVPDPQEDSPGDTGDDELSEAEFGKDYPEREFEMEEEDILADTPAENEEGSEETVNERTGVRSSLRPDPIEDLDKKTSTH